MAFSRQLGVIGILGACFIVAVACDDDGDKIANAGDAGEGGEAGGGKAGSGGKSTGGSSNNSAGDGGTATGGTANDAGAAGETVGGGAGEGGTAGKGGSVAGGGAGEGGDAGSAGDGGGGPAAAKSCGNECEITADCVVADAVAPSVCDPQTHRCIDELQACQTNENCVPWAGRWYTSCASQAECDEFSACVTYESKGYCAPLPDGGFCFPGEALPLLEFGDPDPTMVDVCVNTSGRCNAGQCILSCSDPFVGGCEDSGNGDTCNETTGLCECAAGDECDSDVCGADAHCVECVTDAHCAGNLDGRKTCVAGTCGCGSVDTCPDDTAAATPVCE